MNIFVLISVETANKPFYVIIKSTKKKNFSSLSHKHFALVEMKYNTTLSKKMPSEQKLIIHFVYEVDGYIHKTRLI